MRPIVVLAMLVGAVAIFLAYLHFLIVSPLTTATSLETPGPESAGGAVGLLLAVDNPDLIRATDFTIRPMPIRCAIRGLELPPTTITDDAGRVTAPSLGAPDEDLGLHLTSDTSTTPERSLTLILDKAKLFDQAWPLLHLWKDSVLTPIYLLPALDVHASSLEDADSLDATVLIANVNAVRRPFLYPFDSYILTLSGFLTAGLDTLPHPTLSIICNRSGWSHEVIFPIEQGPRALARVVFRRTIDVRVIAVLALVTLLLLILAIPFQRETGSVLEVSFSFLLGLWGIKSVLVPPSIQYPTIVDSALVGLFALFTFAVLIRLIVSPLVAGAGPTVRKTTASLMPRLRESATWAWQRFQGGVRSGALVLGRIRRRGRKGRD